MAIAAEAPTTPPMRNERTRSPATFLVHGRIVAVRLVCLGDLLLDVIVRLEEPLARGLRADASAVTSVGPGGQAANVAAWAASLGAESRFVGKRADDEAGRLARGRAPRPRGRHRRARRGGEERRGGLARVAGRRPHDGVGSRGRARPAAGRARRRVVRRMRPPAPLRLFAPALADRRGGAPGRLARPARQRRPLVVERDPSRSGRSASVAGWRSSPRPLSSPTRTRRGCSTARCPVPRGC